MPRGLRVTVAPLLNVIPISGLPVCSHARCITTHRLGVRVRVPPLAGTVKPHRAQVAGYLLVAIVAGFLSLVCDKIEIDTRCVIELQRASDTVGFPHHHHIRCGETAHREITL